ncbi:MAG: hydantoinase/oxoprolinase family protein [Acidimicrobiia bacterium]
MTIGADVGGTFTDLVWWDGETLVSTKASSTTDQSQAVARGALRLLEGQRVPLLLHGTTVATNALLERTGARVALVTDAGFEDLLEIARQDRPSLYDHDVLRAAPLIDRRDRHGDVPDSLDADVAVVCLLGSYRDPTAERLLADRLRARHPEVIVVASSEVSAEFREFERLSTTVLTGYLRPVVHRYLARLEAEVRETIADRLAVMQSSGGLIPAPAAARNAASILLSGPAGGVVAAAAFGRLLGHRSVISFDMGGTSTDVCRIEGGVPEVAFEREIEGYVCRLPSVAIHTVGAGGGSIGWTDPAGGMRVGPRSAGAVPGPASYGRGGTEPAVTDADLLIGRLGGDIGLADGLMLDTVAARRALEALGSSVGLSPEEAALGMVEIVEAHMDRAIRRVSVEEGFDPAGAALVAFGGAGGLHAASLAGSLGMGTVLVPPHAGVLSALGLLLAPPRIDGARTVLTAPAETARLDQAVSELAGSVRREFRAALGGEADDVESSVDMRYVGQSHETSVPYRHGEPPDVLRDRFDRAHHRRNGFSRPEDPVEVVTLRVVATGRAALTIDELPEHVPEGHARMGSRQVRTSEGETAATVFRRAGLAVGAEIVGPAVVVDAGSTIWIDQAGRARMHESGTLVIER